jgi:hypothetical protein
MYKVVYHNHDGSSDAVYFECYWDGAEDARNAAIKHAEKLIQSPEVVSSEVWTQDLDLWFCEVEMKKP